MADEKQHPFQNFDSSKLKITTRSEAPAARDTTVVVDEPPEIDTNPDEPIDTQGAEPKVGEQTVDADLSTDVDKTSPEDTTQAPEVTATQTGYTQEDFDADVRTYLGETTAGRITSPDQITAILTENESLKTQLQNKTLEFPSERAKKVYEFAVKNDGNELAAAGQYLRVQSLDLATLSPKDKQFEGFVLSRPDLTREEAKGIFDIRYAREFADIENDIEQKDAHKVRTMEAEKKILAMQDEFTQAPERTASAPEQVSAQDIEKITTSVDRSLSDFGGIVMQYGDSPQDLVKIPMVAEEVSAFREALINPNKLLDRIMKSSMVNGQFNNDVYRDTVYKIMNVDRIVDEIGTNRFTAGQVAIVKDRKNAVEPKGNTGTAAPPKKTMAQTMSEAVRKSEGK